MAQLDKTLDLRIQDIVEKLQKLDCTLLGNKDDAWIMELLFSPGFHRYHLIEWILSKLGYDIGKMSGPQNSAEERLKKLQLTLSDLGFCHQNIHDVIKGTASVREQLEFWGTLLEIISLKHEITTNASMAESDEGIALSPEKRKCIGEEYERACSVIKNICESVNVKHVFEPEVKLLAPDVECEIKNTTPPKSETYIIPTLQDIKDIVKQLSPDPLEQYGKLLTHNISVDVNENDVVLGAELNHLEEELHNVSVELKNVQERFTRTVEDMGPLLSQACKAECSTIGEHFKSLEPLLEDFSQLEKAFPAFESSNLKLSELASNLDDLRIEDTLRDSKYINFLELIKEEI